jgi:uncharacterized protein YutD
LRDSYDSIERYKKYLNEFYNFGCLYVGFDTTRFTIDAFFPSEVKKNEESKTSMKSSTSKNSKVENFI